MAHEIKACRNKANTAPSWKCMQMKMNTLSNQREEGAGAEGFYGWSSEAHTDCKKHIWVLMYENIQPVTTPPPPPPPLFKTVAGRGKSLQVWIWKVSVLTAEVMRLDHEGVSCWVVFWLMGVINHNSNKVCLEYWQEIAELLRQKLKTAHYSVFEYC